MRMLVAVLVTLAGFLGASAVDAGPAEAVPYCDGSHSPCYCPDDNSWGVNAFRSCPRVWVGPELPGENDGPSIWNDRYN